MILGHYRQLGGNPLGCIAGRSLRWFTGSAGGNRAAAGWFALVALPQSLSAPAPLCGTGPARGKSFRPTASSPYRKATIKSLQKCPAQPPMADISIWQKTGHFYFALTEAYPHPGWFWAKSAESIEKKRVEFLAVQKSAQGCEKKELE